jgi:hypothetical protein
MDKAMTPFWIQAERDDDPVEESPEPLDPDAPPFRESTSAETTIEPPLATPKQGDGPPKDGVLTGDDPDERVASMAGRLTQWAYHGSGFAATTRTTAKVPTGTYKIEWDQRAGWFISPLPIVTDNLYRLPDTKSEEVIKKIQRFWQIADRFAKHGYVHKRGVLLWGPPGSGKTATLAMSTQDMLEMEGLVLFGEHPGGIAAVLYQIRQIEPHRPIIVILEDIDTIIKKHGEAEVLAILDGEMSVPNVVFLATTNYPENLDGRVVNRPSRFDQIVKIGMPSADARKLYLERKGIPADEIDRWVELSEGFSIAHLKEMIIGVLCFEDPLDEVVERLQKMAKPPKSGSDGVVGFGNGPAKR